MSVMYRPVNIRTAGQKEAPKEACCWALTGYEAEGRTAKPVLFRDAKSSSRIHTYFSLQLRFPPHRYKLRIAPCMHRNVTWTILKSPSILSRGFSGSCGVSVATRQNLRIQTGSLLGDFAWSFLDSLRSPGQAEYLGWVVLCKLKGVSNKERHSALPHK